MKSFIDRIRLNFNENHFIIIWLVLNFIQITLTELTSDEGYYWFYSTRLEWGYYDHPPLLALLIRLGSSVFSGEAGVRFFNVILISLGLVLLFRFENWTVRQKNFLYLIILSIPLFNYITIIAFPDTPLVAFSILCLYAYKQFLKKNDLASSLLFGLSVALMLYSKYTAFMFVFLIILSNLSLLKNRLFYLSLALVVLLFLPHLIWQYRHDFPSFQYHLIGRATPFDPDDTIQYITQQIPVIGIGIIFIPFIFKPEDQFFRALKFIAAGTLIFFLLYTLRGFVHLHWTSVMLFPVIILSAKYYSGRKNNKLFNFLVLPFLFILLVARVYLAVPFIPVNTLHVDYYHGRKMWAEDIQAVSQTKPVLFETGYGSLREASLYSFYSGNMGVALYPEKDKKSQYQLWNYEDSVRSRDVILIRNVPFEGSRELQTRMGKSVHYREIENFSSSNY